jgi:hypothetical protein
VSDLVGLASSFWCSAKVEMYAGREEKDLGKEIFSGADEAGVEGAREGGVGGALDDGAAIGEEGDCVGWALEAEEKIVEADGAVGGKAVAHGSEVDRAVVLVDLDGVSPAEGNVRAADAG